MIKSSLSLFSFPLRTAVQKTYAKNDTTSLLNAIDPLFQKLSQKNRASFSFNDNNEVKSFLDGLIAPQYEAKLDAWLTSNLPDLKYCSKERVALFSLCYNTRDGQDSLLGTNLWNALQSGDRLKAWFEIRYKSNKEKIQGIANRRYAESDMFGLWDGTSPTQTEFDKFVSFLDQKDPYGANISILQLMRNYEADYNPHNRRDINSNRIDETINSPDVKNYFVSKYGQGQNIDGNVIIGTELDNKVISASRSLTISEIKSGYLKSTDKNDLILGEKGADIIDGGNGNDVIYGGEGNDMITGGTGNDYIEGGAGDDIYYINTGEGTDTIEDKEGKNRVIVNGKEIKLLFKQSDGTYKNPDGKIKATIEGTDLVITDAVTGGRLAILNQNFQDGDFGIHLLDTPESPQPNIVGDLTPHDFDPITDGIQIKTDEWGNIITDSGNPSPNRNDMLYDTTGNDRIEGKGGDDYINAKHGGSDWLLESEIIIRRVA